MERTRKSFALNIGALHVLIAAFQIVIMWATWGSGAATFVAVVCLIFNVREGLKSYLFWRWMKDEEERVRGLALLIDESEGGRDER